MQAENKSSLAKKGQAYREFSRNRYQQLRQQSPRATESQIIHKVIRQWQVKNSPTPAKNSPTPVKKSMPVNVPGSTHDKGLLSKQKKLSGMKMQEEQHNPHQMSVIHERSKQSGSHRLSRNIFSSSNNEANKEALERMHAKNTYDYIKFYRFQYRKLTQAHPSWTPAQITCIIKLQWIKFKKTMIKVTRRTKLFKPKNGIQALRKERGLTVEDSRQLWKRMPRESKLKWTNRSQKAMPQAKKPETCVVMLENKNVNTLNFMNQKL